MTLRGAVTQVFVILLKVGVTFGLAWLVFRNYDFQRVAVMLEQFDRRWLATIIFMSLLQVILLALRWRLLHQRLTGTFLPFPLSLLATGRSLLLGQLLPAVVGADSVRIAVIAHKAGLKNAIRSVATDRIVGLWALGFVVLITSPGFALEIDNDLLAAEIAVAAAIGMAIFFALLRRPILLRRIRIVGGVFAQAASDTARVLRWPSGLWMSTLSISIHALSILLFVALLRGLHNEVPVAACFAIIPATMLIASLPISLGGWGVREATIAAAFAAIGADPVAGTTASILYGLSSPLAGAVCELFAIIVGTGASKSDSASPNAVPEPKETLR